MSPSDIEELVVFLRNRGIHSFVLGLSNEMLQRVLYVKQNVKLLTPTIQKELRAAEAEANSEVIQILETMLSFQESTDDLVLLIEALRDYSHNNFVE